MNKRIAIIGAGNMGGAVARGLHKFTPEYELVVTAAHPESLKKFEDIEGTLDNVKAAKSADIVILGVKPWLVYPVLQEIIPVLSGKLLLSLAAGIPSEELKGWLKDSVVRAVYTVIPNLAAEIGESMTFASAVCGEADEEVKTILDKIGKTQIVNEKKLTAGMIVASCGTAFALRYARAAMEGGIQLGLYPKEALEAVLQTMKGAAGLTLIHGTHPEAEIDKVTTPGGITIRRLNAMEEAGFTNAVLKGIISKE